MAKQRIFLSYSRLDKVWKDRLLPHLDALRDVAQLAVWDDSQIGVGDDWRSRIESALDSSTAAVMLVSANFLSSRFITQDEVPRLLERRIAEDLQIFPLILQHCPWRAIGWLQAMQAWPRNGDPLADLEANKRERELSGFAMEIFSAMTSSEEPGERTLSELPLVDFKKLDHTLMGQYFREAAKHVSYFRRFETSPDTPRESLTGKIREYMINSGLASRNSPGGTRLTRDGTLLACSQHSIPRQILSVDVQLNIHRPDETLKANFFGSVLLLYYELLDRLAPLSETRMGLASTRDPQGSEEVLYEYPPVALTEALVNFLIHRDYSRNDVGFIDVFPDRIEFMNPGLSVYPAEELMDLEAPLRPIYKRNHRLIEAMNKARFNQREGGGILRIKEALRKNRSYDGYGRLGLSIKQDVEKKRFCLVIYGKTWMPPRDGRQHSGAVPLQSRSDMEVTADLVEAYHRLEKLTLAGQDASAVQEEILELKRRLRAGGQLKEGDLLAGVYRLDTTLGRGGFATVWKAYDRQRRQVVAVKVLHSQLAHDRTRRERFFRGARKMATLDHPGIVRVLDAEGEDDGYHFFVMEYLAGGDVRSAVKEKRVTTQQAVEAVLRVGEALQVAHERGILHRDVKPANILLDGRGGAKLTDFDLVQAMDSTGGTRTAAHLGTFLYAAPEGMSDAKAVGRQADIYSLAMTLCFVLYGEDLSLPILTRREEFLASLPCSAAVREVVTKASEHQPEERYESVRMFLDAFTAAYGQASVPTQA